jgi:Tyrosyl-DNA phosphodiesterase
MSSSREDALFRAAIEASLRDSQPQGQAGEVSSPPVEENIVDLTFDSDSENGNDLQQIFPKSKSVVGSDTDNEAAEDDDEDLRAAIALSLESVHQRDDKDNDDESTTTKASEQPPKAQQRSQPFGFLGMDRKKMEEERLARLAKRKADDGDDSPCPQPAKAVKTEPTRAPETRRGDQSPRPQPAKASIIRIPDTHGSDPFIQHGRVPREAPPAICNQFAANDPKCGVRPTARPVPQWPLGAVKQTAIASRLRQHNDITIEEVLQRGDLEAAVLSSFMFDVKWLLSKVNNFQTPVILVMHAKEEETVRMQTPVQDLDVG